MNLFRQSTESSRRAGGGAVGAESAGGGRYLWRGLGGRRRADPLTFLHQGLERWLDSNGREQIRQQFFVDVAFVDLSRSLLGIVRSLARRTSRQCS